MVETRPAAESLILAGRHVLLAARELCAHPDIPSHRERLAAAAKRVLAQAGKVAPDGDGAEASVGEAGLGDSRGKAAGGPRSPLCRAGAGEAPVGAVGVSSPCALTRGGLLGKTPLLFPL